MSRHQSRSVAERLRSQEAQDFGESVYRQLRNAPWLLASVAMHGAAFLVFAMMPRV